MDAGRNQQPYCGQLCEEFQILTFVHDGSDNGSAWSTVHHQRIFHPLFPSFKGSIDRAGGRRDSWSLDFRFPSQSRVGANEWRDKLVIGIKFTSDDRNFRLRANEQLS